MRGGGASDLWSPTPSAAASRTHAGEFVRSDSSRRSAGDPSRCCSGCTPAGGSPGPRTSGRSSRQAGRYGPHTGPKPRTFHPVSAHKTDFPAWIKSAWNIWPTCCHTRAAAPCRAALPATAASVPTRRGAPRSSRSRARSTPGTLDACKTALPGSYARPHDNAPHGMDHAGLVGRQARVAHPVFAHLLTV